jgi:RNA polymerase sigma-70 factor, ECF subfamily
MHRGHMEDRSDDRWKRLMALLEPFHEQALATSRRLCRSAAEGDDLYQDAVLRAYEKLHTLRDDSRFRSWFYVTLLNRHRDRFRRPLWRRVLPWEDAFPDGDGPVGEDGREWTHETEQATRVARALATLVPEQREAVVLFEVDGYSIEEIAAMQRASIPAVKSRLVRGRERLRAHYERNGWTDRVTGSHPAAGSNAAARSSSDPGRHTLRELSTAPVRAREGADA